MYGPVEGSIRFFGRDNMALSCRREALFDLHGSSTPFDRALYLFHRALDFLFKNLSLYLFPIVIQKGGEML